MELILMAMAFAAILYFGAIFLVHILLWEDNVEENYLDKEPIATYHVEETYHIDERA